MTDEQFQTALQQQQNQFTAQLKAQQDQFTAQLAAFTQPKHNKGYAFAHTISAFIPLSVALVAVFSGDKQEAQQALVIGNMTQQLIDSLINPQQPAQVLAP
jgi:hypothetical protein